MRIWENPPGVRVFTSGVIYRPKGVARGLREAYEGVGRSPPDTRGWDLPQGYGSLSGSPFWLRSLFLEQKIIVNFRPILRIFLEVTFYNKISTKTGNWHLASCQ